MHGFFLVDKPSGMTSFDVIRQLKKRFQTKKIGHTGTLDPLATGCLLVAVGEYTKLIPFFEKDKKTYLAEITFGGVSSSYDCEGEIHSLSEGESEKYKNTISETQIESLLQRYFSGEIFQVPPKVSALKIDGKKALDRFRDGEVFEMQSRKATIFRVSILSYAYPHLEIEVEVSAGTYIRSIAHDLGALLGCGGYISALRRSSIGKLDISESISLDDISPENVLNIQHIFSREQCFYFSDEAILQRLGNGQRIYIDFPFPQEIPVFLVSEKGIEYVVEYREKILSPLKKIFT